MTTSATTPDGKVFNSQTPLYNSGILGNYINYLESHHVEVDTDELLHRSGLTRFDLNDKALLLTQEQINAFHRCLSETVSDPDIAFKVGQYSLYTKSTGTLMQYGSQFITPQTMYRAVDRIYPKWSRGHISETVITGKGQAEVTIRVHPGVCEEPFQCRNRQGILEAIGKFQTGQPADIRHPQCMHRGDPFCRYEITWKSKRSALWKRVGAYAVLISVPAAVAAGLLLPAGQALPAVMGLALACLSIGAIAHRQEKKELVDLLKTQGDAAGHLLDEVEVRHHNARLIHEIGLAGADILEVDTFLKAVLDAMSRNLRFSRGLIALWDEDRRRLDYVDGYGFSDAERQFLARDGFSIDSTDGVDDLIQLLDTGQPFILDSVRQRAHKMAPGGLKVIDGLGVESMISVPLIHKQSTLGLLCVDIKGSRRQYTTSDVHLLMGIASQIAAGITNARSYARIQESERRYRLLAENVMDVIWILDIDTLRLTYISPSIEAATGFTPAEIMEMTMDQYLTPASFQQATTTVSRALEAVAAGRSDARSVSVTVEMEEYCKDGNTIPIEVTAGLLVDDNGRPNAVLGISRDLSWRREAEKERAEIENRLQQAKKMESLGTMAGSIAHNFNNLLMVVLGNLELAREDLSDTAPTRINIQRAMNASQRAADLSSMMLTYVGQLKKDSVPVDLSRTVTAVLEKLDESTVDHVTLDIDLADPMPLIAADADQMRQMVIGFVTNAIEALGQSPGRVRISTGSMHCDPVFLAGTYLKEDLPEGMYAYVEVADTGSGMDAETLARVFDPFFSTKFTGRGLGLAAVMGIIRSHHGAVRVHSVKDEGSVFTALFPIQGVALPPASAGGTSECTEAVGQTVLLVDDEAMVMDIGRQFLERLGYTVLTASSGQEAVARFADDPACIDLLLLDFSMPGMDGLETMHQIRQIRDDVKIVITSGYIRQQIEQRFADIGPPDDFIQKPFEIKVLQKKLQALLHPFD